MEWKLSKLDAVKLNPGTVKLDSLRSAEPVLRGEVQGYGRNLPHIHFPWSVRLPTVRNIAPIRHANNNFTDAS